MEYKKLHLKISALVFMTVAVIASMAAILVHERERIREIESESAEIRQVRRDINAAHCHITRLATLGESVIGWEEADSTRYHTLRLCTDSLLQALKPHCQDYVRPAQIDTLRTLLAEKESHLLRLTEILARQDEADSLLVNHLPEVARRATRVRTIQLKKKGIAGVFGGKKTVQVLPSAKELHQFSDSLIALQQRQTTEMDAYADSLRNRNRTLNIQLNRLIGNLDTQAQTAFGHQERKIAEAQALSVRLFTITISAAIVLLFLSYLAIHREMKRNDHERKQREKLIGELQVSNEANEKLIKLRRNLIQNVTHELRTPLTAIHGYAELISNGENAVQAERYSGNIRLASQRMITMLNSLLDFFRLDSGKEQPDIAPFRLQDVADSLQAEFTPLAEAKDLQLMVECETGIVLTGDRERLIQIGDNLLSNAVKFTQAGSVSLKMRHEDDILSIVVEDTGSGMTEEEQQRVFGAFERLSNAATQDGFGLGLSIVRHIVDMLGGTIRVESEKGKGSRFSVKIPMRVADAVSEETAEGHTVRLEKPYSVIALDDNEIVLSMMKDMYAGTGVHCDTFSNVGDIMEALRTRHYDLLITDLKMPEINGFEVLELLRSSHVGNSQDIPVVVATASGICDEEELLAKGFAACLFKPFSPSELLALSEKCLSPLLSDKEEQPDLTSLLAYGDKAAMLDRLIAETEKDMKAVSDAGERCDRKRLDEWVHRLRSSWAVIRADKPLWALHGLLHRESECSDAELREAVNAVLAQGETIIHMANEERRQAE